jgi:hypothetical protein
MISIFSIASLADKVCPNYPAILAIAPLLLFASYVVGGLYHGYRFAKEK